MTRGECPAEIAVNGIRVSCSGEASHLGLPHKDNNHKVMWWGTEWEQQAEVLLTL